MVISVIFPCPREKAGVLKIRTEPLKRKRPALTEVIEPEKHVYQEMQSNPMYCFAIRTLVENTPAP